MPSFHLKPQWGRNFIKSHIHLRLFSGWPAPENSAVTAVAEELSDSVIHLDMLQSLLSF